MEGTIKNITGEKESAVVYEENGKQLAQMVYQMTTPSKLVILHTEVDDVLQGKSMGKQLQKELVAFARANNIKVVPLCPFARAMFNKMKEWRDVLV